MSTLIENTQNNSPHKPIEEWRNIFETELIFFNEEWSGFWFGGGQFKSAKAIYRWLKGCSAEFDNNSVLEPYTFSPISLDLWKSVQSDAFAQLPHTIPHLWEDELQDYRIYFKQPEPKPNINFNIEYIAMELNSTHGYYTLECEFNEPGLLSLGVFTELIWSIYEQDPEFLFKPWLYEPVASPENLKPWLYESITDPRMEDDADAERLVPLFEVMSSVWRAVKECNDVA